jgi:hypothetical protein
MNNKLSLFLRLAFAIFIFLISNLHVFAQSIWLDQSKNKTIAFEFLKPDFDSGEELTFLTSAMFLSGRFATSEKLYLVGEISFANYGGEGYSGESYTESAFGNPYLGLEFYNQNKSISGEFGFRLPMAPKDENQSALMIGFLTDFVERAEAFVPETIPFNLFLNYRSVNESNFGYKVRGGITGWIPSGDRDENEWFLVYTLQGGYQTEQVNILLGISGRYWLSRENVEFSDSIFHQFVVTTNFNIESVRPGLILKLPLNENLQDMIDLVFGVSLAVNLK